MRIQRWTGLTILCLVCLHPASKAQAQAGLSPAEQGVWQRELDQVKFLNSGNLEGFLGLLHPDFLGWSRQNAGPTTKEERRRALATFTRDGRLGGGSIVRELLAVRLFGDIGMVYYREKDTRLDAAGKRVETSVRTTHTWKRTDEGWKLIGGMSAADTPAP